MPLFLKPHATIRSNEIFVPTCDYPSFLHISLSTRTFYNLKPLLILSPWGRDNKYFTFYFQIIFKTPSELNICECAEVTNESSRGGYVLVSYHHIPSNPLNNYLRTPTNVNNKMSTLHEKSIFLHASNFQFPDESRNLKYCVPCDSSTWGILRESLLRGLS